MRSLIYIVLTILALRLGYTIIRTDIALDDRRIACQKSGGTMRNDTCVNFSTQPK